MTITVKHKFVSAIPDGTDATIVRPSNWNDDHDLVGTVPVSNGGTGQSTATDAFNALAPSQTGNSGKYLTTDGTNTSWSANASGDVVGPASATDNAITRFDGTTGKLIQNSVVTIGDTGAVSGFTTLAASTSVTTPIVQASNSGGLALKNASGTTQMSMGAGGGDNMSINVSTNLNGTNAQIDISPTGTGHVHMKPTGTGSIEIAPTNVGTIDNMTIGATTAKNASFVDLSVTGTTSFDGSQGTAGQVLTSGGTGVTPTWATPSSSGGLSWQSVQTANFTAVAGNAYPVNTTSGAITVTLPASPTANQLVTVVDYAGTAGTNNITINPNGNKLQGSTYNAIISTNRQAYNFVYVDATQGWLSYAQEYASATQATLSVEALVVAGGGGGGGSHGGAGGAGGLIYSATQAITLGTAYTVTVGAGGAGGDATPNSGTQGANSVFSTLTSIGGGYGAKPYPSATVGGNGGSGGGGGRGAAGGTATSGQGYAGGGSSGSAPNYGGGGGGGAGAVGADGTTTSGGNGGDGVSYSITGSATYYAGGGGGGTYGGGTLGTGGLGGGGNGGAGANGASNTGGGGGAGSDSPSVASGSGGSGVVIIAFPTSAGLYINPITGSLTYTSSTSSRSGYTVYTFTGGTGTITFTTTNPNLDPYWTDVSLLTNSENLLSFADASTNNFPITNTGGVAPSLNTPVTGGGSQYFNGSSRLSNASANVIDFGTNNFTVEMYTYLTSSSSQMFLEGPSDNGFQFYLDGSGIQIGFAGTSPAIVYSPPSTIYNAWNHWAIVRTGTGTNQLTLYLNGVQVAQGTFATNVTTTGFQMARSSGYTLYGFVSNVRIVKGTAIYTTTFTPPTAPLTAVSGTSLLINGTNQNTFDNATFYDQSANSFALTKSGSPVYSGLSPFGNAYPGSVYLDGSSNLAFASNTALNLTGDFTIETWFNFTNLSGSQKICLDLGSGNFAFSLLTTNVHIAQSGVADLTDFSATINNGTWYHVALSRTSGVIKCFLNGTQIGSNYSNSTSFISVTGGTIGAYSGGGYNCAGNLSNLRVVKGTGLYTSNFTPSTTPLTAVTNTSLLLGCDTGAFYDLSNVGNPISQSGSPVVTTQVSPFSSVTESYYFDGSSYLPVPNSTSLSFGTGDFTFEGWFYASSLSGSDSIVFSAGNSGFGCILRSNAIVTFQSFVAYNNSFSTTLSNSTWYYIAISRTGSTITCYVNGTSIGSASNSTNYAQSTIGAIGADETGGSKFTGYINNLRITKGVGRYTATFTPPTAPFPTSA